MVRNITEAAERQAGDRLRIIDLLASEIYAAWRVVRTLPADEQMLFVERLRELLKEGA